MTLYIQALSKRYYAIRNGVMLEIKLYHFAENLLFWHIALRDCDANPCDQRRSRRRAHFDMY